MIMKLYNIKIRNLFNIQILGENSSLTMNKKLLKQMGRNQEFNMLLTYTSFDYYWLKIVPTFCNIKK